MLCSVVSELGLHCLLRSDITVFFLNTEAPFLVIIFIKKLNIFSTLLTYLKFLDD